MIKFMTQHWEEVLQIIGAAVALATLIVKITPSPKDDDMLAKIIKILSVFSLCNPDGSFIGKKEH